MNTKEQEIQSLKNRIAILKFGPNEELIEALEKKLKKVSKK